MKLILSDKQRLIVCALSGMLGVLVVVLIRTLDNHGLIVGTDANLTVHSLTIVWFVIIGMAVLVSLSILVRRHMNIERA